LGLQSLGTKVPHPCRRTHDFCCKFRASRASRLAVTRMRMVATNATYSPPLQLEFRRSRPDIAFIDNLQPHKHWKAHELNQAAPAIRWSPDQISARWNTPPPNQSHLRKILEAHRAPPSVRRGTPWDRTSFNRSSLDSRRDRRVGRPRLRFFVDVLGSLSRRFGAQPILLRASRGSGSDDS
jgi:hypothetical protein